MTRTTIGIFMLAATAAFSQQDPGPRAGTGNAGEPLPGLTAAQLAVFLAGQEAFLDNEGVKQGLGPRFNLDSCGGCHAYPSTGGSSPARNPQIEAATKAGALNSVPSFLTESGPVKVVRFKRRPDRTPDGGVHALFVITGRNDAPAGCNIIQEDFSNAANLTFRIPTPMYGAGLMEAIPDGALLRNLGANRQLKQQLGIGGRLNHSGNDGTITRFGWKAQNKSLMVFSGEAYNVEMGVTNEQFPNEREDNPACATNGTPEDESHFDSIGMSDLAKFSTYMRFLDAPQPGPRSRSVDDGRNIFDNTGCALCHTPQWNTGRASVDALTNRRFLLYSDLALHNMGTGLADGISQGEAGPADFRSAPLWGLGQRLFFLHDGRAANLVDAIEAHASEGSEANQVIERYRALPGQQKQDLLSFLRSL